MTLGPPCVPWAALIVVLFFLFIMAIYHCNHSHVGRNTHRPGTAAAHISYITRESATTEIMASRIPEDRNQARRWIIEQEIKERKNGRVIDKVNVALPLELTYEQQKQLVMDYGREMSKNRVPWLAVMHTKPQDAHNPHAHLVFRDRDIETGKRVMMTTERGSTERFREVWEHVCNTHLAMHGHDVRIDRRTLKAQGIDRQPQIHVGPEANAAVGTGADLRSNVREDKKKIGQDRAAPKRKIDYPVIDKGMTRRAFNEHIIDLNLERLRRSLDYGIRLKADFEAEQRRKDRDLLKQRDDIRRFASAANGDLWEEYRDIRDRLIKNGKHERERMVTDLKSDYKPLWKGHFERRTKAFEEFGQQQREPSARLEQLKRSLPHLWSRLEPTQDQTRGKLSAVFKSTVTKEDRLTALTEHYKAEHQKLYTKYSDDKRVLYKLLRNEHEHDLEQAKKAWQDKRGAVRLETDRLWQDYGKQVKERNREKIFERENLQNFIDEYHRDFGSAPPSGETTRTNLQERIEKAREQTQHHGEGGQDKPASHEKPKTVLQERIEKARTHRKDGGRDYER